MTSLKSVLKLGLLVIVVGAFVTGAFLVGYQAGNGSNPTAIPVQSEVGAVAQPSVTPAPTVSPTPVMSPQQVEVTAVPDSTVLPTPSPDMATSPPSPPGSTAEPEENDLPTLTDDEALQILQEVWNLVESEYYGELPPASERVYAAIRGMLGTLDDEYTSFSEPSIAEIRRADASGSFEGIGALVTMNDENILEIVQPYEDSPAASAGLKAGDKVLAVDGESIVGYGIYEAITLIRGPEGTEVELTIQRGDAEPFKVSIVRARLDIQIVDSRMLDDNIGYVSLFEFSSQATDRLEEAIQGLLEDGATSLIFDLRGNPGGFLPQAVQVSDLFLDEGLVLIERRSDGEVIEYTSTDEGLAQDLPLVVLVNRGSASASEIVAGAIQDRKRGILIGETTFGKGSVQLLHTLSDRSELRVTVARWFTPNDRAIHGAGLTPDIEVTFTPEDQEAGVDPQLDRGIEYLKTGQQ
jgi:carboxyl-terminal processing protease